MMDELNVTSGSETGMLYINDTSEVTQADSQLAFLEPRQRRWLLMANYLGAPKAPDSRSESSQFK